MLCCFVSGDSKYFIIKTKSIDICVIMPKFLNIRPQSFTITRMRWIKEILTVSIMCFSQVSNYLISYGLYNAQEFWLLVALA